MYFKVLERLNYFESKVVMQEIQFLGSLLKDVFYKQVSVRVSEGIISDGVVVGYGLVFGDYSQGICDFKRIFIFGIF